MSGIDTYHPSAVAMYDPYIGPSSKPPVVAQAQAYIIQTRFFMLNMSSRLPDTMIEGTAETKPDTNLPTTAPYIPGTNPTKTHESE